MGKPPQADAPLTPCGTALGSAQAPASSRQGSAQPCRAISATLRQTVMHRNQHLKSARLRHGKPTSFSPSRFAAASSTAFPEPSDSEHALTRPSDATCTRSRHVPPRRSDAPAAVLLVPLHGLKQHGKRRAFVRLGLGAARRAGHGRRLSRHRRSSRSAGSPLRRAPIDRSLLHRLRLRRFHRFGFCGLSCRCRLRPSFRLRLHPRLRLRFRFRRRLRRGRNLRFRRNLRLHLLFRRCRFRNLKRRVLGQQPFHFRLRAGAEQASGTAHAREPFRPPAPGAASASVPPAAKTRSAW